VTDPLALVSAPRRRAILRLIWDRERSAGDIHRALGDVTFGAVSQHLRLLEGAGVVSCREQGRQRIYLARKDALGPLGAYLESMWSSVLDQLKVRAELEEARRGPRPKRRRRARVKPREPERPRKSTARS
jgi:DNA-binding transcriptional ArsR family regulator